MRHASVTRRLITLLAFVGIAYAAGVTSAQQSRREEAGAAANRPVWGTVMRVAPDSVTIQPDVATRAGAEPRAERTFAVSKDKTEFAVAEVGMAHRMADGSMLRTLNHPEPATVADVQPEKVIEITPGDDGSAKRIVIVWSVRGSIVKVNGDSIVFRPAAQGDARSKDAAAAASPQKDADPAADDETLTVGNDTTRVRIAEAEEPVPTGRGRGFLTTVTYRDGTLADLKPDQSVVVCVRDGAAAKITIHTARPAGDAK